MSGFLRSTVAALMLLAVASDAMAQMRQQEIRRPRQGQQGPGQQGGGPQQGMQPGEGREIEAARVAIHAMVRAARLDEAETAARALLERVDGRTPDHPMLGPVLATLANVLIARGRNAQARETAERARAVFARAANPNAFPGPQGLAASILGRMRQAEGRAAEALALAQEAIALRERQIAMNRDAPDLAANMMDLANNYREAGRQADAERMGRQAVTTSERLAGADHASTARILISLGQLLQFGSSTAEVRGLADRALTIAERGGDAPLAARARTLRAAMLEREGRLADAEADLRRALPVLSRGGDEQAQATAQVYLASVLAQRAATAEAERIARQAIPIIERFLGRDDPLIGIALTAQGRAYRLAGRPAEAEPLLRRAIAIRQRAITNDPRLPGVRVELALALEQVGRAPEAISALEPYARDANDAVLRTLATLYLRAGRAEPAETAARGALAAGEQSLGADAPQNATTRALLGRILVDRGRPAEAETLLRSAIAAQERALGAQHPDVAASWFALARALEAQRKGEALDAVRRAARLVSERFAGDDESIERGQRREIFALLVVLAQRAIAQASETQHDALLGEAFRAMQQAKEGSTALAVARMAERAGADNPRLAEAIRVRSDAADEVGRAAAALRASVGRGAGGDAGALAAARARLAAAERALARDFPAYARLFGGRAPSLADMRGVLAPDEALADMLVTPQQVYVMVIRADRVALAVGNPAAAREIAGDVRRLRDSVDPSRATSLDDLPRFDFAAAHRVWQATLGPAADLLDGVSHIFVVPDGPLQSIPFAMLLTAAHDGELKDAPWLMNRFATTTLPASSTLRALRAVARPTQAAQAFLGVGDPVLTGPPGAARGGTRGQAGGLRAALRSAPPQLSRIFTRNGLADVRSVRELTPLPETADELRAVARALGAGGEALVLGRDATERRVRAMDLSRYRVISFATHGLTAGEVPGFAEPGLVLTPPERATPEDDGVLGVSTIARLRLDADMVILSACNTAAPDGSPGAEALSGLARAFLYAGARSLLASHWPVESQAAVRITTGLFAAQQADTAVGRAEALRRAQRAYVEAAQRPMQAHPLLWAPFVLVGEGGRPIAVAAPAAEESPSEDEEAN